MNNNPNMEIENSTKIHVRRYKLPKSKANMWNMVRHSWKPGLLPSIGKHVGKMNMNDAYQSCWSFADGVVPTKSYCHFKHLYQKS